MNILGISGFYHDSAAAVIQDGKIIAAAQEERFSRIKFDPSFPVQAIKFCLEYSKLSIDDIDAIAFYDKPLLKFERLLDTYYVNSPKGVQSFISSMPVWMKEKLFIKKQIITSLKKIEKFDKKKIKFLFPEHHLSHAASCFFTSNLKESAILTIDGVGEWATATFGFGSGNKINILKQLNYPHSLGLLYSAFTYFLGFKVNSGEYKMMGLASYGNPDSLETKRYIDIIRSKLVDIKEDGSIFLNQEFFSYSTALKMIKENRWEKLFGIPVRQAESEIFQSHCDLAYAIQNVTEEIVLKMAVYVKELTGSKNLSMAGGVALNCVANGKLLRSGIFDHIYIQPAAGDAGGAIGAALAAYYIYFNNKREEITKGDLMNGCYLGPEYSDEVIEIAAKSMDAIYKCYKNEDELLILVANYLKDGKTIGWFQGRMEFGPRALGNRSILADPRNPEIHKLINQRIKYREEFRPFAPVILAERCGDYFEPDISSPYMLFTTEIKKDKRYELPEDYFNITPKKRLDIPLSDIPSVTHRDFSARIQTVDRQGNEKLYALIKKFDEITGCPVLINTSFNVRNEPIVCTPEEAYQCFMKTQLDYLVMNNYLFRKEST